MPKLSVQPAHCSLSTSPNLPRHIPAEYDVDASVVDEYSCKDPDGDDCLAYLDKAAELASKKILPSFDVQADNYYQWPEFVPSILLSCSSFNILITIFSHRQLQSIRGLSIDLATEEIYPPPLCHHAANRDRPLEWCTMSVVLRHRDDLNPNTAVVGYLTPLTHQCIFRMFLFHLLFLFKFSFIFFQTLFIV